MVRLVTFLALEPRTLTFVTHVQCSDSESAPSVRKCEPGFCSNHYFQGFCTHVNALLDMLQADLADGFVEAAALILNCSNYASEVRAFAGSDSLLPLLLVLLVCSPSYPIMRVKNAIVIV